jgi:hypothetical protein
VVFPANDAADAAERGLDHADRRAVTKAPNQPLEGRRHELAVLGEQPTIGAVGQRSAIEGSTVPFDDAKNEMHAIVAGDLAEARRFGPRQVDRTLIVAAKILAALGTAHAQPRAEVDSLRVAPDERLRENHEVRALVGGLARQAGELHHCLWCVEQDRTGLNDSGFDGLGHRDQSSKITRQLW